MKDILSTKVFMKSIANQWFVIVLCLGCVGHVTITSGAEPARDRELIFPGKEGRYHVRQVASCQPQSKWVGTLGGYDVVEMPSPAAVSGMGKMMACDRDGNVWFTEQLGNKVGVIMNPNRKPGPVTPSGS